MTKLGIVGIVLGFSSIVMLFIGIAGFSGSLPNFFREIGIFSFSYWLPAFVVGIILTAVGRKKKV
jgi:hypothetical protein